MDVDTGEDHRAGPSGELRFAGPTVFSGYFRAEEMTRAPSTSRGYYRTGDLFEIAGERNQFYRYVGRSEGPGDPRGHEHLQRGRSRACWRPPGVREVAVVGVPDPVMGEKLCACGLGRRQPVTLQQLCDYLRHEQHVAVFKLPEYVLHVPSLPRNPVGKILKRELRQQARTLARRPR